MAELPTGPGNASGSNTSPKSVTSTSSGRSITTEATNDHDIPANAPATEAKIGTVKEALDSTVPTVKPKPAEEKKQDKTEQPILSLAALREHHIRNGTAPTTEQVQEVKELEAKIAEEGGKVHRTNPIEKGK